MALAASPKGSHYPIVCWIFAEFLHYSYLSWDCWCFVFICCVWKSIQKQNTLERKISAKNLLQKKNIWNSSSWRTEGNRLFPLDFSWACIEIWSNKAFPAIVTWGGSLFMENEKSQGIFLFFSLWSVRSTGIRSKCLRISIWSMLDTYSDIFEASLIQKCPRFRTIDRSIDKKHAAGK